MKNNMLMTVIVASAAILFSLNAYAIHDTQPEGTKFPLPGPDAEKLYNLIVVKKPNYLTWSKWPGKQNLSPAKNPHGPFVTTYLNSVALDSIKKGGAMADGSVIIMENYSANKDLEGCTVMYKIKGYNPEAGDWFWAKYAAPNGYVLESGKVTSCIACHSAQKSNDYLY